FNIKPDAIGIMGFSAGGTLATSLAYHANEGSRPDFAAPVYAYAGPEIRSTVASDAPPVFLVAATDDQLGLASHSIDIYKDWLHAKRSVELHMYAKGGHGFGMRKQNLTSDSWIDRFGDWLYQLGYMRP